MGEHISGPKPTITGRPHSLSNKAVARDFTSTATEIIAHKGTYDAKGSDLEEAAVSVSAFSRPFHTASVICL